MKLFAYISILLFLASWCVGAGGLLYGTRFWLPLWAARFRNSQEPEGYAQKAARGYAVMIGAVTFGFITGGFSLLIARWQ